ncbi:MAG: 6-bladed beta-propeller, partial [Candidatus Eisenbacteria bacterium]|nr:6-bladed beta-propeller [Candidatus Eisenbacteria bacterium]
MKLRLTLLAAWLFAVTACLGAGTAGAADWAGKEETRDGALHVMNPAKPQNGASSVDLEELWRIGGDTDDDNEFFGVIMRITNDAEGNVYLLDMQLSEVKVFGKNGKYVRTIGREGEGPGEFRRPTDLFFVPGGNLGVLQAAPAKIVLLTKDGKPAGEYPTPKIEGEGFLSVSGARLAGDQLVCMAQASNFDQEK